MIFHSFKKNLFFLLLLCVAVLAKAQQTGTLRDTKGEIIRGTPMVLGGNNTLASAVSYTLNPASWTALKDKKVNTVRVCWVDPYYEDRPEWGASYRSEKRMLDEFDICLKNAKAAGLNLMINYHHVGEYTKTFSSPSLDMSRLRKFWQAVAPRYKDEDNVYYEIVNEPIFGQAQGYNMQPFKGKLLEIYNDVRLAAPKRQILMFTFNEAGPGIVDAVNGYKNDLNWNFTSVAFHMYSSTTSQSARTLMNSYRVVCTEWDYDSEKVKHDYIKTVDGYKENVEALERIGCGWVDWRGWGATNNDQLNKIITDATQKNYLWWASNNKAPKVTIPFPENKSVVTAGSTVTIAPVATDEDGKIAKVDFVIDGVLLKSSTTAPHKYDWKNVKEGLHTIEIQAIDDKGGFSSISRVEVIARQLDPSKLSIIGPDCIQRQSGNASYELVSSVRANAESYNWYYTGVIGAASSPATALFKYNLNQNFATNTGGYLCVTVNYKAPVVPKSFCKQVNLCNSATLEEVSAKFYYTKGNTNELNVELNKPNITFSTVNSVKFYAMNGKYTSNNTFEHTANKIVINTQGLGSGNYIVKILTDKGPISKRVYKY
jgi:hypothetical protein